MLYLVCKGENSQVISMLCSTTLAQMNLDNLKKLIQSNHKYVDLSILTDTTKKSINDKYEVSLTSQKGLQNYVSLPKKISLAPYKLAFVITQKKQPFSHAEDCAVG